MIRKKWFIYGTGTIGTYINSIINYHISSIKYNSY